MVSKADLGLIFGGVLAATSVAALVISSKAQGGRGGGGGLTYTVTIQVTDATGLPLAGASVTLGASLPLPTDVSGTAIFTGFVTGSYTLTVIATGYQAATQSVQVLADSTYSVTLSPTTTCLPQPCSCGYSYSSIPPCGCVPQKVASLSVPPTFHFTQSWTLLREGFWFLPATVRGYATPGNPSQCPPLDCTRFQRNDTIQVLITAVVKDVNGNPVCGVPVSAGFTGVSSIPWTAANFSGLFEASLIYSSLNTDNLGTVFFVVNVKLSGLQSKINDITQGGPYPGSLQIPFGLLLSITGTPIIAPVLLTMNTNLCTYYPVICIGTS